MPLSALARHPLRALLSTLRWVAPIALTATLALWLSTIWGAPYLYSPGSWQLSAEYGAFVGFSTWSLPGAPPPSSAIRVSWWTHLDKSPQRLWSGFWVPRYGSNATGPRAGWWFHLPFWLPAAAFLILTAIGWLPRTLAARRAQRGHCPACSYDLSGLPESTTCPECGAPSRSTTTPPPRPARTDADGGS